MFDGIDLTIDLRHLRLQLVRAHLQRINITACEQACVFTVHHQACGIFLHGDAAFQNVLLTQQVLPLHILGQHRLRQHQSRLFQFVFQGIFLADGSGHLRSVFAPKIKFPCAFERQIETVHVLPAKQACIHAVFRKTLTVKRAFCGDLWAGLRTRQAILRGCAINACACRRQIGGIA